MKWAVINKMSTPMQNSSVTGHGGAAENDLQQYVIDELLKSEKYKEVSCAFSWIKTQLCDDQVQEESIRRRLTEAENIFLQTILILEGRRESELANQTNLTHENKEALAQKDAVIQQLQTDLDEANHLLDDAYRTMGEMQSPKSKEAMESTYSHELRKMKQLVKQLNEANDNLEVQLGQSRDENGVLAKQIQELEGRIEETKCSAAELENENAMIVEQLNEKTK